MKLATLSPRLVALLAALTLLGVTPAGAAVPTHTLTINVNNYYGFPADPNGFALVIGEGSVISTVAAPCVLPTLDPANNPTGGVQVTCTAQVPVSSTVLLAGIPDGPADDFEGWGVEGNSDCQTNNVVCMLTMDTDHIVTASFGVTAAVLTVDCQPTGAAFCDGSAASISLNYGSTTSTLPFTSCEPSTWICGTLAVRLPQGMSATATVNAPADMSWTGCGFTCAVPVTAGGPPMVTISDQRPGRPTNVVASVDSSGMAAVSFAPAVLATNGLPADSYTVIASPGGATFVGASSPIDVSALPRGQSYSFEVMATNGVGASVPSNDSNTIYLPPAGVSFDVSWTAAEDARLLQAASYLNTTPQQLQHDSVFLLAFLLGLSPPSGPTPVTLPPVGSAATYTSTWLPSDLPVLDAVKAQYLLDDIDAHRIGVYLIEFLLALGGH